MKHRKPVHSRPGPSRERATAWILAGLLAAGCLSCSSRPSRSGEPSPRIVWPPPPSQPRIEFVKTFQKPRELGIRKNWFVRLVKYLGRGRRRHEMVRPFGLTVAPDGRIIVADPDSRSVHVFDQARSRYQRISRAEDAPLGSPIGVAADLRGRIYVSDSVRGKVFRFNGKGKWLDSFGEGEDLLRPTGIALDRERALLYVVDTIGHRIVVFDLEGRRIRTIGRRGKGAGEFNFPVGIALGPGGHLHVTDSMNFRVQILDAKGRFLRSFGRAGTGPGDFDKVKGIAVDADGQIYVVEALHDVIHVFDREGELLTVIGGTGTGLGEFWLPAGIHIDPDQRIWIADSANHRVQVLHILAGGREGGGER